MSASLPDASGAGAASGGSSAVAELDPEALLRLRELDPTGASKLMERVVSAFNGSSARLVLQLEAAKVGPDAAVIRHVAHTLKSSSASVGAVKLSRLCAEMEAMARQGRTEDMEEAIAALCIEVSAVLEALKRLLDSPP